MPTLGPHVRRFLTTAFPHATPEQIEIVGRSLASALEQATAPADSGASMPASLERLRATSRAFQDALRLVQNDGDAKRLLDMSAASLRLLRRVASRTSVASATTDIIPGKPTPELATARLVPFLISARDAWSAIAIRDERGRLKHQFGVESSVEFVRELLALGAVAVTPETVRIAMALLPRERGGVLKRRTRRPTTHWASSR